MPLTAAIKKRPNLVLRHTLLGDIERTQFDFQRQDEFTELLFLINGSTAHRNN